MLDLYQEYAWLFSEVWDIWRGFTFEAVTKAHPILASRLDQQKAKGLLYLALSNHVMDILTLPQAFVFEGFGRKVFSDHGHLYDWPNCRGWKVGRLCVRVADELRIHPETSPYPSSPDRHVKVMEIRQELADNNPEWDFFWGHTHAFYNEKNNHNDGSPITGKLTYFLIEEGIITPIT